MAGDGRASVGASRPPIKFDQILNDGELGKFCGNAEEIGWLSADRGRSIVHPVGSVKKAIWFEGQLQYICESEKDEELVAFEGFPLDSFDVLWRHFEQNCGIYLQRKRAVPKVEEADFDHAMRRIEAAADRVDEAEQGSVQKKAREADLMKGVEGIRDGLELALGGDREALSNAFSANDCERIGRMRLVLATVQLEIYRNDARWEHLRRAALSIEGVLRDLGTYRAWTPPTEDESMMRRQMVWELIVKQGGDPSNLGSFAASGNDEAEDVSSGSAAMRVASEPAFAIRTDARAAAEAGLRGLQGQLQQPAPIPSSASRRHDTDDANVADPLASKVERDNFVGKTATEGDVDVEVTDPNQHRANAIDSSLGPHAGDGVVSRLHYMRPDSVLEGWVWKRSRHFRRWRRRYLILGPRRLETFKPGRRGPLTDDPPTESFEVGSVFNVFSADLDVQQKLAFGIVAPRTFGSPATFYMVCDLASQKTEWMTAIAQTLCNRR